jgi:hypothetical protein
LSEAAMRPYVILGLTLVILLAVIVAYLLVPP